MRAFVIAMECEADCVRPWLKDDDLLLVCGIGKVNAAAATQQAISTGATEVWNAGLAGGFGSEVKIGGVYAVGKAVEYDFDLADLNGTRVGQLDEFDSPFLPLSPIPTKSPLAQRLAADARVLATADRFSDKTDDYDLIVRDLGATLRDMEGAAIAHVCIKVCVPCYSVKCVSDVAGGGSMTGQYEKNRSECLAILSRALGEILR